MPISIGQILANRYRVDALLGQGGFGAVYRVWDLNLSHSCALCARSVRIADAGCRRRRQHEHLWKITR